MTTTTTNMKFLIIDDSSVDARALISALETFGHSVDYLEDTENAIGTIEAGNYQAVFLDVVMPERDGYKLLRSIRLNESTANQYVVFHSSKSTSLEINYGIKRAGANDYLPKPIAKDNIEQVLAKIPMN